MKNKLPAFQFYPGDWMKDADLRRCSHASKGVWIDMLCLAFECEVRGVFVTAGRPWTIQEIACAVGGNADVTLACIQELVDKGVAKKRCEDGAIYCKRMVCDEESRKKSNERVGKWREKHGKKRQCNAPVTQKLPLSSTSVSNAVTLEGVTATNNLQPNIMRKSADGTVVPGRF